MSIVDGFAPKELISKDRTIPPIGWPPIPTDRTGMFARCPSCGRIKSLRICYSCKNVMCYSCLIEHQITCLKKGNK